MTGVEFMIETVLSIQRNRRLLAQILANVPHVKLGEASSDWSGWDQVNIVGEILRDSYYDLGKMLADSTVDWNEEKVSDFFRQLDE